MPVYINGDPVDSSYLKTVSGYFSVPTLDLDQHISGALGAWRAGTGYGLGDPGPGFLNVTTSGTTGHPTRISHSRDTIEQVVESNIRLLNLSRTSRIFSIYSPRGIAFTVLSLYMAEKLGCEVFVESFNGLNYVDRLNATQPSHTLILPNVWKTLHRHDRWQSLDLSNCETAITGSDFTPKGMLDELKQHGAHQVYNVYGSTEVPPMVLISSEENTYSISQVPEGCQVRLEQDQIVCKWSTQRDWWYSGDCVEGDEQRFLLKGRLHNMFKQDHVRVYPEQIEKQAVLLGADLALCQQMENHCVLHYTGTIQDLDSLKKQFAHIPRFKIRMVENIQLDGNLKKIIRTQSFD
jgi:acyl-CoA synthetase (AMP-forming)/AMP-acid ligase II